MKVPKPRNIEFSPLLWKESIASDSELQTVEEMYSYFLKHLEEKERKNKEWLKAIEVEVSNRKIRKLINGYAVLDVLDWDNKIQFLRFKMWQLFEDLVEETLREALRPRVECTVVHVDKLKGFRGLDFVIANSKKKEVWTVGIQCKRYVGSALPKSRIEEYGPWSRGTSAPKLCEKGKELHERFPKKKFVLAAFRALRTNEREKQRFRKLRETWDLVMVFDKSTDTQIPYTYKISLPELKRILRWC